MRHTLHILQACEPHLETAAPGATDSAALACRAHVESHAEHAQTVIAIASTPGERRLREIGLAPFIRVTAPLARPTLAKPALRRVLREIPTPDSVLSWTPSTTALARSLFSHADEVREDRWTMPASPPADRDAGTTALGAAHEPVVSVLADPPHLGDARSLQYALGMLEIRRIYAAALIPAGTAHTARARRFHRSSVVTNPLVISDLSIWPLLPRIDAAVLHVPGDPARAHTPARRAVHRVQILTAHLRGVAVVAPRHADGSDPYAGLIDPALLADSDHHADIARTLSVWFDRDTDERAHIRRELRTRAQLSAAASGAPG